MHANARAIDAEADRDVGSTSAMRAVWSDQARVQHYLDIERALCVTQGRLGVIPTAAADEIAAHCDAGELDFARLPPARPRVGSPVLPVVEQLTALCKDGLGQWCHWGATTQDITDTATVLQLRDALALVEQDLEAVRASVAGLARRYRDTPMVGPPTAPPAAPMMFGYQAAVWLASLDRHRERLAQLRPRVLMGEFGGAEGTLALLGAHGLPVQQGLMEALGLAQPPIAWYTARDTIAEVGCFLALVCGSLDTIATDVKRLTAAEPDGAEAPTACARTTACGRAVRQYAAALLSAVSADAARATGTWEIEWLALPAICGYAAGALAAAKDVLGGLVVHPEDPRHGLQLTDDPGTTDAVVMALAPTLGCGTARDKVSAARHAVAAGEGMLLDLLAADPDITQRFDRAALERLLDPATYLGNSGAMVDRVLAGSER